MSVEWYPVIDHEKCSKCGVCHRFCSHGVYIEKDGKPVVVNPHNCVHGCRGCQSRCESGAIQYMGEDKLASGGMVEITDGDGCPLCGQQGQKVAHTAVINLVKEKYVPRIEPYDYYLCPNPSCQAVYYSPESGQVYERDKVRVRVWLKDTGEDVPLCYCHGVTRGHIKEAWRKGARTYVEVVKATGASSGECRCRYENPAGKCCSAAIKKYLGELSGLGEPAIEQRGEKQFFTEEKGKEIQIQDISCGCNKEGEGSGSC